MPFRSSLQHKSRMASNRLKTSTKPHKSAAPPPPLPLACHMLRCLPPGTRSRAAVKHLSLIVWSRHCQKLAVNMPHENARIQRLSMGFAPNSLSCRWRICGQLVKELALPSPPPAVAPHHALPSTRQMLIRSCKQSVPHVMKVCTQSVPFIDCHAGGRICGQLVRALVRLSGAQVRVSLTSYAVIGAAAYMGGSTRMTLTSVVMVMETTGALQLIVPIMLTVFFAKVITQSTTAGILEPSHTFETFPASTSC